MKRWRLLATALAVVVALTACGSGDNDSKAGPQPLTDAQAQLLAVIRLNGYNAEVRAISGTLTDGRSQVALRGWVDLVDHTGYALVVPSGEGALADGPFLVTWTLGDVATVSVASTLVEPPLPIPDGADWQPARLDPRSSFLATTLLFTLNLGYDRPENPQLLAQSSARFLRDDTVGGIDVEVFTGPESTPGPDSSLPAAPASDPVGGDAAEQSDVRYWVDSAGGLRRVELRLGEASGWSVLDLPDAPDVSLDLPAAFAQLPTP